MIRFLKFTPKLAEGNEIIFYQVSPREELLEYFLIENIIILFYFHYELFYFHQFVSKNLTCRPPVPSYMQCNKIQWNLCGHNSYCYFSLETDQGKMIIVPKGGHFYSH